MYVCVCTKHIYKYKIIYFLGSLSVVLGTENCQLVIPLWKIISWEFAYSVSVWDQIQKKKTNKLLFFKINLSKALIPPSLKDYSLTLSYCGQVFLMDYDTLINKQLALGRIVKLHTLLSFGFLKIPN